MVSSFRPRFRIVFIMPGMENFAPERTLSSSGSSAIAQLFAHLRLRASSERFVDLIVDFFRNLVAVFEEEVADLG